MERKNKACWNCGNYKAYYTQGFCHFDKLDYGLCKQSGNSVNKHEECEHWKTNYRARLLREQVAVKKLDGIMDNIVEIRQILFENTEGAQKTDTDRHD